MGQIIWLSDERACSPELVGGKGANLGRLTKSGFTVPPAFVISTAIYTDFLRNENLGRRISALLDLMPFDDSQQLERITAQIRALVIGTSLPDSLQQRISAAYRQLGDDAYVAIRSSGVAEDLAEASFAGLHDTFLDVRSAAGVLDAVKCCWASLWSGRATFYRHTKGYGQFDTTIAVVVQAMVESEAAGVLFTGNPLNAATDEMFINASWGLGEAVVQGIVTPDQYVVKHETYEVIHRTMGSKTKQIVRDEAGGSQTITEDVPEGKRERFVLSDSQLTELATLGRHIQDSYAGFPQDIEWGLLEGRFYVLQSRPITGVEFSWDAAVTDSVWGKNDPHCLWSRKIADEWWTGAVTPLFFSVRALEMTLAQEYAVTLWGFPELRPSVMRLWKYFKGEVYYNIALERATTELVFPPPLRYAKLSLLPSIWHDAVRHAPFDWERYISMWERIEQLDTKGARFDWARYQSEHYFDNPAAVDKHSGLSAQALRQLSDGQLKHHISEMISAEVEYTCCPWTGEFLHYTQAMILLQNMLHRWYDGSVSDVASDLLIGSSEPSATSLENHSQGRLAERIRSSAKLLDLFRRYPGKEFFSCVGQCGAEGAAFLAAYNDHVKQHGHRGHADRDYYYTRRAEDPTVDYRAFELLLHGALPTDGKDREAALNARRLQNVDEVVRNISQKPLGLLKVEAFKFVLDYVFRSITARDKERYFADRSTYAQKKGFLELNRRCMERGLFDTDRDFYFLTMQELYGVHDGKVDLRLAKMKIVARMRNFDRFDRKESKPPMYLKYDAPFALDAAVQSADGVLHGIATSKGSVTGIARVVKTLTEIHRLQPGNILVANSTDPGWTTAFLVIKGVVLETGGVLAHGSLLAREYGLPAVQIEGALQHIPDGATITVDGNAGSVTVLNVPQAAPAVNDVSASARMPAP